MSEQRRGPKLDAAAEPPLDIDVRDAYVASAAREALGDETTWEHDLHLLLGSLYVAAEGASSTVTRAGQSADFESAVADVERGQVVAGHLHDDAVLDIVESDAPERERIERLGDELLEPSPSVEWAVEEVGLDPEKPTGEAALDAARAVAESRDGSDGVTPGPRSLRRRRSLAVSTLLHQFTTGTRDEDRATGHPLDTAARWGDHSREEVPSPSEAVEEIAEEMDESGPATDTALRVAVGAIEDEARAVAERRAERASEVEAVGRSR